MKKSVILLSGVSALSLACAASAETVNPSVQSMLSTMNTVGGSETLQWQVAPTYSELFGLGVRGTVGGYVNEDFALGVIIDYAEHREEYLANAGVRINDNMRVIGSVGILKESEEFTLGDGREDVSQLEYGLSLKGNYEAGIVHGFEVNAYHTNGKSDTDAVETGDLTGIQVVTQLKPSDSTDLRLGAGYEKAEWDGGDVDEGFTLQALGSQKLSDKLALNFEAKSAETEDVYGLGFTYDLSSAEVQNSSLSINFDKIEGKHGISDDTRVALNWTVGFGASGAGATDVTASSMGSMARADLLADVMTRPAFLPERVLARGNNSVPQCLVNTIVPSDVDNSDYLPDVGYDRIIFSGDQTAFTYEIYVNGAPIGVQVEYRGFPYNRTFMGIAPDYETDLWTSTDTVTIIRSDGLCWSGVPDFNYSAP